MMRGFLLFAVLVLVVAAIANVAFGHQAQTGWTYGAGCCSGRDCAPIPPDRVQIAPEGYLVTLEPGDGPFVRDRMQKLFAYPDGRAGFFVPVGGKMIKKAMESGDSEYHACVTPGGSLICLYVPRMDT